MSTNLYFINSTKGYRREKIFAEHAEMLKYILIVFLCEIYLYAEIRADCIQRSASDLCVHTGANRLHCSEFVRFTEITAIVNI